MDFLAKMLFGSFLMHQPEVTQPALASSSAFKVLRAKDCLPLEDVLGPVPWVSVEVWGVREGV